MSATTEVNTSNDFMLAANGVHGLVPLLPVQARTRQQAFRLAAWLVLMGEMLPDEPDQPDDFDTVLKAVSNT